MDFIAFVLSEMGLDWIVNLPTLCVSPCPPPLGYDYKLQPFLIARLDW